MRRSGDCNTITRTSWREAFHLIQSEGWKLAGRELLNPEGCARYYLHPRDLEYLRKQLADSLSGTGPKP